jgi:hypothetical protein
MCQQNRSPKMTLPRAESEEDLQRKDRGLRPGPCFRCGTPTRHAKFKDRYACPAHEAELVRGRVAMQATFDPNGPNGTDADPSKLDEYEDVRMARLSERRPERPIHFDESMYSLERSFIPR